MKKIVCSIIILFGLLSANVFAGQIVERSIDGKLRHTEDSSVIWSKTPVTVTDEAIMLGNKAWQQAYNVPDKIVPVQTIKRLSKIVDMIHVNIETILVTGVIYETQKNLIRVINEDEEQVLSTETESSPFVIFWTIAVVAMIISNYYQTKRNRNGDVAFIFISVAFIAAAFAATTIAAFTAAFTAIAFAFIAAFATIYASDYNDEKTVHIYSTIYSTIFYIAMVLMFALVL